MSHDGSVHEFRFPDIGEGLTEGRVVELRVARGQHVRQGDALAVVETDKVVTEIPSPFDGEIVDLPVTPGAVVRVGEVVALIRTKSAVPSAASASHGVAGRSALAAMEHLASVVGKLDSTVGGLLPPSTEGLLPASPAQVPAPAQRNGNSGHPSSEATRATPLARRIASISGIDLSTVQGTGPGGRILKRDLPASSAPLRQKLSVLRNAIAVAMEKSQAIPAAAVHDWTIVDELLKLRKVMNEGLKEKLGLLAFFVKAAAMALRKFPLLSSIYFPEKREFETHETPHIGVAVDTDEGLVVPVIRNSSALSISGIQAELTRLTEKARSRHLSLDEIRGGTFTISNFGSFSGVFGNPMILPPQVAILGVGRIHEMAVVKDGAVTAASVLPLSLVVDHRLIDGAYACKFLAKFMELISQPMLFATA
ncbi:MAG TPA: dihydrolipoamide acetyltransferase family protein [Spirochaetia bacterium]|nr:dihydrolipoamide acetyltransferase family protein [Spirochaetia bacterium]